MGCTHEPPTGDLLQDAVVALLRRVPKRWAEYDADTLTATEEQALFLLVAAGMVERRIRFRMRLHNHPVAVEATITATGEYGLVEAMQPLLAWMWLDWKDALHAWKTGEARAAPLSINEHLTPDGWRLTDQGALALADLDAGGSQSVVDFVLRRGFFDGERRLILEPGRERVSCRESVRGSGQLVTMRKVQADAVFPVAVKIENWKEGADAFAAAFQAGVQGEDKREDKQPSADACIQGGPSNSGSCVNVALCDDELAELERATPPLNRQTGKWVKNDTAAEIEGVKTRTLADYRSKGVAAPGGRFGRDKDGRIWRREGTETSHPWYLRSTLKNPQ